MKKCLLPLLISLCSLTFAETNTPTTPTPSSNPLPTMEQTKNIDTVLSEKVQSIIAQLPILKGQSVTAASHNQIVTLEGSVETKQQEKAAIDAAYSIKEVKNVVSHLTIKGIQ